MANTKHTHRRGAKQTPKDHTLIYALSHPVTGEIRYVGQTCRSIEYRLYEHIRDAKIGKWKFPVYLWIRKLVASGLLPCVTLLEFVPSGVRWQEAEMRWIAHYRQALGKRLLNVTDGGDGTRGYKASEETRAKISAIAKAQGRKPPGNLGRTFSPEARANMSKGHLGKSIKRSDAARARMSKPCPSRQWTPGLRARIMASRALYITTDAHKVALSAAGKRAWGKRHLIENEGQGALPLD